MIQRMRARGSNPCEYDQPGTAETLNVKPTHAASALGFRLVHDDSGRAFRDGSWSSTSAYVAHGIYFMADPDYDCPSLGFRLAREGT